MPSRVRTLRLVVAYDGAEFAGWQRQAGLRTVQGELERVLSAIDGAPVHVAGAGRTDAGVHAAAQVASVRLTAGDHARAAGARLQRHAAPGRARAGGRRGLRPLPRPAACARQDLPLLRLGRAHRASRAAPHVVARAAAAVAAGDAGGRADLRGRARFRGVPGGRAARCGRRCAACGRRSVEPSCQRCPRWCAGPATAAACSASRCRAPASCATWCGHGRHARARRQGTHIGRATSPAPWQAARAPTGPTAPPMACTCGASTTPTGDPPSTGAGGRRGRSRDHIRCCKIDPLSHLTTSWDSTSSRRGFLPAAPRRRLLRQVIPERIPRHVAIIMDGNGRWAAQRHLPRVEGHRAGIDAVRDTVETSARLGLDVLTLYAFSVENWKRPTTEVSVLMGAAAPLSAARARDAAAQQHPLHAPSAVPTSCPTRSTTSCSTPRRAPAATPACSSTSRSTTAAAPRSSTPRGARSSRACRRRRSTRRASAEFLYTAGQPDPDLLIRTSGEMRVSNFLLWQIAYAEIWVTDTLVARLPVPASARGGRRVPEARPALRRHRVGAGGGRREVGAAPT